MVVSIRAAVIATAACVALGVPIAVGIAQTAPDPGAVAYEANCAACHGRKLEGGFGLALSGDAFRQKWDGKGDALLAYTVKNMPPASPGSLGDADYRAITAYVQRSAGLAVSVAAAAPVATPPAGTVASPSGVKTAINQDAIYHQAMAARAAIAERMTPVTDAALAAPAPGDWPSWRRDYAALGFSPLALIDKSNVGRLKLAWSLALSPGTNQIAPLAWQGMVFVNSTGTVQALDGATGDVIWENSRPSGKGLAPVTQPRSMALSGTSLFVLTNDNHLIALDARTGRTIWDHEVATEGKRTQFTGGPIVAHGKVIQGAAGCGNSDIPGGCFIVALDAVTGKELWRFRTIARPGEPNGDSWNGAPLSERFGGSVWLPGSYDPDLNLVYFGVGQTYHAAPLLKGNHPVGPSNAALYTNSTLALDVDSGKLVWHYQHFMRDVWDLDWSFERQLITLPAAPGSKDQRPRRIVATIGKLGILDALDAKTGKYLFSADMGLQDLVSSIDPKTGRKIVDPKRELVANTPQHVCPYAAGVRNWPSTAYDAASHTLFVPMTEDCMMVTFDPSTPSDGRYKEVPRDGNDGKFGRVAALDLVTGKFRWIDRRRAPQSSAILATGGDLIFEGGRDRMFRALDADSGTTLWSTRLNAVPNAFPISFAANGRQYVAITTGGGGPGDASRRPLTPEYRDPPQTTTLYVFELGE